LKDDISTLITLQEIDTELAGLDREIASIQQGLASREQAVKDREAEATKCRERAAELAESRHAVKALADEAAERIKERQVKMMQVQTSREHQALLKEIEDAKRQIRESEDQMLQVMEDAEAEEKKAAELENLCKGEHQLLTEAAAEAAAASEHVKARQAEIMSRRSQRAVELSAPLLARYSKLLVKRKGLAVVRIAAGVCQGCFMAVPPQQFNQVRKGGEISSCPACQRILYYIADSNEPLVQPVRSLLIDEENGEDEEDDFEDELTE
jgi:hypothetical protein